MSLRRHSLNGSYAILPGLIEAKQKSQLLPALDPSSLDKRVREMRISRIA
jgi:hypothetical protein